ncbi:MAG TPA: hypothetical protein VL576_00870 [Candidatus Paceibacterota bacterium]|jgi:hypothetical protein|nr:hypothetical protein [Candidatus Paceibacterota bacterium]
MTTVPSIEQQLTGVSNTRTNAYQQIDSLFIRVVKELSAWRAVRKCYVSSSGLQTVTRTGTIKALPALLKLHFFDDISDVAKLCFIQCLENEENKSSEEALIRKKRMEEILLSHFPPGKNLFETVFENN